MNNQDDDRPDHSVREGSTDAGAPGGPADAGARRPRPSAPDDRLTTIIPAVTDDDPSDLRDPVEAVKAA
ncbi:MAG: hypothetical protein ABI307_04250, partial [Mycobacterium sp.]